MSARRIRRGQVWHDGDRRFVVVERGTHGGTTHWRCVVQGGDCIGGWCSPEFLRGLLPDPQRVDPVRVEREVRAAFAQARS